MPDDILAQYAFIPWLRRGIATEIREADDLGSGSGTTAERAQLAVELQLSVTPTAGTALPPLAPITKAVSLLGPGDVVGIRRSAIIRSQPHAGATNFEANGLAYVDFYEEDFPWRYSPARPAGAAEPAARQHKLRPWFALILLKDDEFTPGPVVPDQPPSIVLDAAKVNQALPLHTETWAWAHSQVSRAVATPAAVHDAISTNPEHALSRVLCPRRLEPETSYHAFVIPSFETGRLAGLGEPTAGIPAQAPAWVSGAMPHSATRPYTYPVYFQWQFRTGARGDFESLVRALVPGPVGPEFGKRDADVRTPGYGLDAVAGPERVQIEGALRPPQFQRAPFPAATGAARTERLEQLLDLGGDLEQGRTTSLTHPFHRSDGAYPTELPDDPIVTPPAYGRRHADLERIADARNQADLAWLRELNLDFRSRAAAGLGVEVVQKRQEEFMERAWEQVGELEQANQRLREAELALAVGESLFAKHLAGAGSDRAVRLTAAAQRRVLGTGGATLYSELVASQVPQAVQSAAFKRASRPQRKLVRSLTGSGNQQGLQRDLLERCNAPTAPLSSAPRRPEPPVALELGTIGSAVQAAVSEFATEGNKPGHILLQLLVDELRARLGEQPPVDLDGYPLATLRTRLRTRLDGRIPPGATGEERLRREQVEECIAAIGALSATGAETAEVRLQDAVFDATYGTEVAGKSYAGVTITRGGGTGGGAVARMTATSELLEYQSSLASFGSQVAGTRLEPPAAPRLTEVATLAGTLATALRPKLALASRVVSTLRGVTTLAEDQPRRLRPVMAHPSFPDPMFDDLRQRSRDFVIPNYSDLPQNTLTLLESNQRFIEAYLAGVNEEMARELLWREYPTDQRGTYFQVFWDTRDSILDTPPPDIRKLHEWRGALGAQSGRSGGYLVLVIRGELFKKYPNTVVYAQRAVFAAAGPDAPRELSDDADPGNLLFPALQGELQPDIAFFGFPLSAEDARGDRAAGRPGWFFVLMERPGEVNFGLDEPLGPLPPLGSWDDLNWGHLSFPTEAPAHIGILQNPLILDGSGGTDDPTAAHWGRSSADLAYILFQNPVLYARHAAELLP